MSSYKLVCSLGVVLRKCPPFTTLSFLAFLEKKARKTKEQGFYNPCRTQKVPGKERKCKKKVCSQGKKQGIQRTRKGRTGKDVGAARSDTITQENSQGFISGHVRPRQGTSFFYFLQWVFFSPFSPGFLCNLVRKPPHNVENIARFPGGEKVFKA